MVDIKDLSRDAGHDALDAVIDGASAEEIAEKYVELIRNLVETKGETIKPEHIRSGAVAVVKQQVNILKEMFRIADRMDGNVESSAPKMCDVCGSVVEK